MNTNEYVNSSMATNLLDEEYDKVIIRLHNKQTLQLLHAAMGMVTEAGELMDALKKHLIYGKELDLVNLKEECGDSFWYQALLAKAAGFTFEEAMVTNFEKLSKRYPGKFTEHAALNRDLNAERKILEK